MLTTTTTTRTFERDRHPPGRENRIALPQLGHTFISDLHFSQGCLSSTIFEFDCLSTAKKCCEVQNCRAVRYLVT
jgi:hypothetical protein